MTRTAAWLAAALVSATSAAVHAQSSVADARPAYNLHGFVLADYATRVASGSGNIALAETRGRLEVVLADPAIDAEARFKLDAFHDAVVDNSGLDLREAYLDYRVGPFDFRLGRQVLSWGVGDLEFVNDVFPKDYGAFFVGRPIEYLKVANDALRTTVTLDPVAVDLVAIPLLAADATPGRDRFRYAFDPFAQLTTRTLTRPDASWSNAELAARIHGSLAETDLAAYAFRGFFHSPSSLPDDPLAPTTITDSFPALSVYGASLQRNALGGVISAEAGYNDSRDNRSSRNPLLPSSSVKLLAGYQREVTTDFTVGIQYVGQAMRHHDTYRAAVPPGFPVTDAYVQTATLRVTRFLLHQTLRLSAFAFLGITERDLLVMPETEYKISDRLSVVLGANIFAGNQPSTTFGVFRDNTNVYAWSRLIF
jgi:hypothetical protein